MVNKLFRPRRDDNRNNHSAETEVRLAFMTWPSLGARQVAEVSNNRVPDRVVMTTCGAETPKPFACKVFVYEGAGQYDPKLSVVLEDVGGQWKVSQWL
jgi:hypothetical protein